VAKVLNKQPLDFEAMIRGGADLWRDHDAHLDAMEELVTGAADDAVALREVASSTLFFVRAMAVLSPLFVAGGVGVALLHSTASDPLRELAALEPGEVVVVGRVSSPPVPTGFGYRADLRVEHLWYEDKEVLRGGGVQVYAGDLPFGVGDRLRVDGELTRPEVGRAASITANT
jgi:hypothetical protein